MASFLDKLVLALERPLWQIATLLLIVAVPMIITLQGIYYVYFHPLSKVPGPKLYAFSQLPHIYHILKGDWHLKLTELHDEYGPVVRYAYKDVSFTSAVAIKTLYNHKTAAEKTFEKDGVFYDTGREASNIISANKDDHRRMRRLIAHAFSEKALSNQESVLKHYVDLFIAQLAKKADSGTVVDLVSWYNFATFDLIGDLAFGQSFGCLDTGSYNPWVRTIFDNVKFVAFQHVARRLSLESFLKLLMPAKLKRGAEEHMELSTQTAKKRIESGNTEREDFMSYFLRYNDERGMSTPELADNANILIIAGSETTATLLSGTTFHLLMNPEAYKKIVTEVRSAFESEDMITVNRVGQLSYMLAALNEGFRMYPPVPISLPRVVPDGGDFIEGYFLPRNTIASVPHLQAFQTPMNFKNPQKYAPERWMGDPEYASDERAVLQPFSIGPRNCIGKNLAYAEMRLLLARLLWNFDLELMPESQNWDQQKVFAFWEKGLLKVKLTRVDRKSKVNE